MTRTSNGKAQAPHLRPLNFRQALSLRMARLRFFKAVATTSVVKNDDPETVAKAFAELDIDEMENAALRVRDALAPAVLSLPLSWFAEPPSEPINWSDPATLDLLHEERYTELLEMVAGASDRAEQAAKNS